MGNKSVNKADFQKRVLNRIVCNMGQCVADRNENFVKGSFERSKAMRKMMLMSICVMLGTAVFCSGAIISDDFNRPDSALNLGSTAEGYAWARLDKSSGDGSNGPGIKDGRLYWLYTGNNGSDVVYPSGAPAVGDFQLDLDFYRITENVSAHTLNMWFRLPTPTSYIPAGGTTPGYGLYWYPTAANSFKFTLYNEYGGNVSGTATTNQDWTGHLTLIAQGNRIQVIVDGTQIIDYTDNTSNPAANGEGYFQFYGNSWRVHAIDNLVIVPEPATIGLLAMGTLGFIRRK